MTAQEYDQVLGVLAIFLAVLSIVAVIFATGTGGGPGEI